MSGYAETDCKVPCLQTMITVQDGPQQNSMLQQNVIFITINHRIQREVVLVDKFDFMESLNILGSNLGLWPGLGLFHLFEMIILILVSYQAKKKLMNQ